MLRRCPRLATPPSYPKKVFADPRLASLPEVTQLNRLLERIDGHAPGPSALRAAHTANPSIFSDEKIQLVGDAALLTLLLHIESRFGAVRGESFYTIGPCGEELLAPIGLVASATDPMALHYRHLAVNLARQLKGGEAVEQILLNRARGYCVSSKDPVTGGAHCALGGSPSDFIVTSTLASQMCPAVGRALGGSLAHFLKVPCAFPPDFVSVVSLGDGSVNNGHYLSGENLAQFASFRGGRVPLVTVISDNGLAISFKNHGYLQKSFAKRFQCPVHIASGQDVVDVWLRSQEAFAYARTQRRPCVLIIKDIVRRFGHAATDRQGAYFSPAEIQAMQDTDPVGALCVDLVRGGYTTKAALLAKVEGFMAQVSAAFALAKAEPKLTSRQQLVDRVSAPLVAIAPKQPPPSPPPQEKEEESDASSSATTYSSISPHVQRGTFGASGRSDAHVLRKHMTAVFDEVLTADPSAVYYGEDVQHGGYYLVTDGLSKKHSPRVQDFPPDETSLVGAAMGAAQAGLHPVLEIPYAKYLDCAMDLFTEAAVMHWLSNGTQPNGMVVRLQGFGRGVFGGNYHTHNMLHLPPGIDVVCYSNGRDYARGMRYAAAQSRQGRVVMSVDCTELLNMREIAAAATAASSTTTSTAAGSSGSGSGSGSSGAAALSWEFPFTKADELLTFDDVVLYRSADLHPTKAPESPHSSTSNKTQAAANKQKKDQNQEKQQQQQQQQTQQADVLIVTYGNGLPLALQLQHELACATTAGSSGSGAPLTVDVCDCPLLSAVPAGLEAVVAAYRKVLFADPCKAGQHPLASHLATLLNPARPDATNAGTAAATPPPVMRCIAAPRTYNPLGTVLTFLSKDDMAEAVRRL